MPAEFQKDTEYKLIRIKTFCIFDDILIVSKESEEIHKQPVFNQSLHGRFEKY